MDGTTVKRSSLHNIEEIHRKDIRKNDWVVIEKTGGIIPQVVHVCNLSNVQRDLPIVVPTVCPSCKSPLYRLKEEVALRCVNFLCPSQLLFRLCYYCSRDAMDIAGLGHSTLKQLIEHKLINSIKDLVWTPDFYRRETMALKSVVWYQNYRIQSILLLVITGMLVGFFW